MRCESARHDEVGIRNLPGFLFHPERLNSFAHEIIGLSLFRIGEAGPRLSLNKQISIDFGLKQNAGGVAEHGGDLACFGEAYSARKEGAAGSKRLMMSTIML